MIGSIGVDEGSFFLFTIGFFLRRWTSVSESESESSVFFTREKLPDGDFIFSRPGMSPP